MSFEPTATLELNAAPFVGVDVFFPSVGPSIGVSAPLDENFVLHGHASLRHALGPSIRSDGHIFTSGNPQVSGGAAFDVGYSLDFSPFDVTLEVGPDVVLRTVLDVDVDETLPAVGVEARGVAALTPGPTLRL